MADRVTLLTQYFYPDTGAVPQLLEELVVGLRSRGLDVQVYTAQPSYTARSRQPRRELYKGVRIRRIFSTGISRHAPGARLLNGLTFAFAVAVRLLCNRKLGVILVTTNPAFLPWIAWLICWVRRHKYVILVYDLYPDVAIRLGYMTERGILARIWRYMNRRSFPRAEALIVMGKSMKEAAGTYLPDAIHRVHVIHSWANAEHIVPYGKDESWFAHQHGLTDKFVVLYSGNIGLAHKFETLVEAAEQLKHLDDLRILFIGEGAKRDSLLNLVAERGLRNVLFVPHVPYDSLPYSLAAGDVGVVTLEQGVDGLCEPSKLYGYLAAGHAILGLVGERSEVAEIIERHGCGIRVGQDDVDGTVAALKYWIDHPGELRRMQHQARQSCEQEFTTEIAVQKYFDLLANL